MSFVLSAIVFGIFWVVTLRYLWASYRLVNQVREDHPDFWRGELGAPRFVGHHRQDGLNFQYRFYLEPVLPFLRWLLLGSAAGLTPETQALHRRTRRLLVASAIGFSFTLALFLLLNLVGC